MPIPIEVSTTWNFLHGEVVWLHARWTMYRQLYGTNAKRIETLNQLAPTFFGTLQGILLDEVQLTLSRLADPAVTADQFLAKFLRLIGLHRLSRAGHALIYSLNSTATRPPCSVIRAFRASISLVSAETIFFTSASSYW